ncbi:MAG: hypothetical protein QW101_02235 [Ignisphaera sp.]|uniref:Uncharacterized protein n=1 Tax=Ignisphaera aggregans TaxID=334771 RepID=A0A7J3MXP3_9CREN
MDIEVTTQICIDYKSRCAHIKIYNHEGRNTHDKKYCGIELINIEGITRIPMKDIATQMMCINVETSDIRIVQVGSILRVESDSNIAKSLNI